MTITGTWECVVDSPMGKQLSTATLVESGADITGQVSGLMGVDQVVQGHIEGAAARFKTEPTVPFPMTLEWVFTVDGDTLSGTVEAGPFGKSPLTGTRA